MKLGDGPLRILVIRPDRIGDVVLSTPVFELLKRQYPKARISVLVQKNVLPILRGLKSIDHFFVFDPKGVHAGIQGFFRLVTEIRRRHFQIGVVLQSHWKISAALYLAGVRYRVGPLSKLHSYLFFNRGMRQRRSQVEMHETDYNIQLLQKLDRAPQAHRGTGNLGLQARVRQVPTQINISETTLRRASEWLKQMGWDSKKPLILIHPGMGGSALNWPEAHYIALIRCLMEEGRQVLISGGPAENALLSRIEESTADTHIAETPGTAGAQKAVKAKAIFYRSQPRRATPSQTVDFLAALCKFSQLVIAPSTGPLHLAVALGKPVVTFYPPLRVQSAVRWGPYLPSAPGLPRLDEPGPQGRGFPSLPSLDDVKSRASILVPDVHCGQESVCLGKVCIYFPCMKGLTVKQALEAVHSHLGACGSSSGRGTAKTLFRDQSIQQE